MYTISLLLPSFCRTYTYIQLLSMCKWFILMCWFEDDKTGIRKPVSALRIVLCLDENAERTQSWMWHNIWKYAQKQHKYQILWIMPWSWRRVREKTALNGIGAINHFFPSHSRCQTSGGRNRMFGYVFATQYHLNIFQYVFAMNYHLNIFQYGLYLRSIWKGL